MGCQQKWSNTRSGPTTVSKQKKQLLLGACCTCPELQTCCGPWKKVLRLVVHLCAGVCLLGVFVALLFCAFLFGSNPTDLARLSNSLRTSLFTPSGRRPTAGCAKTSCALETSPQFRGIIRRSGHCSLALNFRRYADGMVGVLRPATSNGCAWTWKLGRLEGTRGLFTNSLPLSVQLCSG